MPVINGGWSGCEKSHATVKGDKPQIVRTVKFVCGNRGRGCDQTLEFSTSFAEGEDDFKPGPCPKCDVAFDMVTENGPQTVRVVKFVCSNKKCNRVLNLDTASTEGKDNFVPDPCSKCGMAFIRAIKI